jgi:DNA helicase HerA-like ATPase
VKSDGTSGTSDRRVGRVVAVSASRATLLLDRQETAPVEMGDLVKMRTRAGAAYAMVSRLEVTAPAQEPTNVDLRIAEIEFAGEAGQENGEDHVFRRGTSAYPRLDDPVWLATHADLQTIYARPAVASTAIGSIHQDHTVSAYVLTDELLGKNWSIVGSTGSGKSCLVAAILDAVLDCAPNAHLLLLDPHSEYAKAFGARATVLSPGSGLYFPYWLFNLDELTEIVLGPDRQADQAKILAEAVLAAKQSYFQKAGLDRRGTVDTPAPYRIADVLYSVDAAMGSLDPPESIAAYRAVIARINALQNDARYNFVFSTRMTLRDELCDIIAQLFRIPVAGKPMTILDLAGIPSEAVNVIVSVLCRLTFDFALWSTKPIPITIVCEEAHRYAPRDKSLGFEGAKRALFRIAKEGRKYGVSLCIVSQRPADLAPGLLSECNTMFAFRMTDQEDQSIVRSAAPESSYGLLNFLPALRNAETIAIGEGVSLPMRINLLRLPAERRPRSITGSFIEAWQSECDGACIEETVERWRWGFRDTSR